MESIVSSKHVPKSLGVVDASISSMHYSFISHIITMKKAGKGGYISLSPILHLFYNADLLEIYNRPGTNISTPGLMMLMYWLTKKAQENCLTLEAVHRKCEKWANRPGVVWPSQVRAYPPIQKPPKVQYDSYYYHSTYRDSAINRHKSVRLTD